MTVKVAHGEFHLTAPAKLNLYLHIVGVREDGYHLLDSLVVFAGLHDELAFASDDTLSLVIRGPFSAALGEVNLDDNLVLRAARHLARLHRVKAGAAITLTKNLPVAAGIGGGSADAAATLLGLARLWNLDLDARALGGLGLELGADVPVCIESRPAFMGGIGEELTPATGVPAAGLVLVNPGVALSTAAVFKALGGTVSKPAPREALPEDAAGLARYLKARRNDLAAPAMSLAPGIETVRTAIAATPDCLLSQMSGSGTTCFGLYADRATADVAAATLAEGHPEWWVAATELFADA
ncbi:MAG: 4-(cytidine 5'-diphospho)-2-C-methyl-D-erythritol kinase [Alphaproteobacteria bacterium]|nr:4-(cytidine 5'-diphospho)-2-C-methyl-D-erythritol kinase [Alphaproteobacteria bacterium]